MTVVEVVTNGVTTTVEVGVAGSPRLVEVSTPGPQGPPGTTPVYVDYIVMSQE